MKLSFSELLCFSPAEFFNFKCWSANNYHCITLPRRLDSIKVLIFKYPGDYSIETSRTSPHFQLVHG